MDKKILSLVRNVFLFLFSVRASFPFIYLAAFYFNHTDCMFGDRRNFLFSSFFSRCQQARSRRRSLHFLKLELPGLYIRVSEDEPVVVLSKCARLQGRVMGGALTDTI